MNDTLPMNKSKIGYMGDGSTKQCTAIFEIFKRCGEVIPPCKNWPSKNGTICYAHNRCAYQECDVLLKNNSVKYCEKHCCVVDGCYGHVDCSHHECPSCGKFRKSVCMDCVCKKDSCNEFLQDNQSEYCMQHRCKFCIVGEAKKRSRVLETGVRYYDNSSICDDCICNICDTVTQGELCSKCYCVKCKDKFSYYEKCKNCMCVKRGCKKYRINAKSCADHLCKTCEPHYETSANVTSIGDDSLGYPDDSPLHAWDSDITMYWACPRTTNLCMAGIEPYKYVPKSKDCSTRCEHPLNHICNACGSGNRCPGTSSTNGRCSEIKLEGKEWCAEHGKNLECPCCSETYFDHKNSLACKKCLPLHTQCDECKIMYHNASPAMKYQINSRKWNVSFCVKCAVFKATEDKLTLRSWASVMSKWRLCYKDSWEKFLRLMRTEFHAAKGIPEETFSNIVSRVIEDTTNNKAFIRYLSMELQRDPTTTRDLSAMELLWRCSQLPADVFCIIADQLAMIPLR